MDRLAFPYVEESHLPPLHRFATSPLGASSVPVLVTEAAVLKDSGSILKYVDRLAAPEGRLYPSAPALWREVDALAADLDARLGIAVRQWGYFHGLQDRLLMQQLWCEKVPPWQRSLFPITFPVTKYLANRAYSINAESAKAAYRRIQRIFGSVGDRLADGRKYLVGDQFSAADLTFACLSAPVLLPPEYGGVLPELGQLPNTMAEQTQSLRETPAGQYALRLYQQERWIKCS